LSATAKLKAFLKAYNFTVGACFATGKSKDAKKELKRVKLTCTDREN